MRHLLRALILFLLFGFAASGQQAFDLGVGAIGITDSANPTFFLGTVRGLFSSEQELGDLRPVYIEPAGGPQPNIAQVETERGILYVRAVRPDQLWRSEDGGTTWALIMSGLPTFDRIEKLYVLPVNPPALLVHLQVGPDALVYRSDDRGSSWARQAALPDGADDFGVNLNNPDIMFAETGRRIWRSINGGQDWASVSLAPFEVNQVNGIVFIAPDPQSTTNVLMGGGGGSIGTPNGVYRSVDQGATWERRLDTVANRLFYAADWPYFFHNNSTPLGHVDISSSRGRTWTRVDFFEPDDRPTPRSFDVDPRDDRVIYMGTGSARGPVFRSEDGGNSWVRMALTVRPTLGGPTEPIVGEIQLGGPPRSTSTMINAPESSGWEFDFTLDQPTVSWLDVERDGRRINLTFNSDGLSLGEHRTQLVVRSDDTVNPEFRIDVLLRVVEAGPGNSLMISTVAGNGENDITGEGGPATEAGLDFPTGMAVGTDGSIIITVGSEDIVLRVDPNGTINRFAGTGEEGFAGDGGPALQAQLDAPNRVVIGLDGTVYFNDLLNRRVRKVERNGRISTFAGTGDFRNDAPPAGADATLLAVTPDAMTLDSQGDIIAADGQTLYRFHPDGSYQTIFERLSFRPDALAANDDGTFYAINDDQVMLIQTDGTAEVFAGLGVPGYTGDGGAATEATFNGPEALAVGNGMVFIADTDNQVIRMVAPNGIITTFAGTGAEGFAGDGGAALSAEFDRPEDLAYMDGRLYVLDRSNRRVRLIEEGQSNNPQLTQQGVVNAAGFNFTEVSPDENISIFGVDLALQTALAQSTPLPTELAGTRVTLTDSTGTDRPCRLFFVAALQINCNVDGATALGLGTLTVETGDGGRSSIQINVVAVAPGLFSANATGAGVAAAVGIRIAPDGAQSVVDVFDAGTNPRAAIPIDLGPDGEQVVLLLFGTGFRGFQNSVEVTIDGQQAQVVGVAAQGEFVGLDQINVVIPRSLIGAGEVEIRVIVDGKVANVVTVRIA